MILIPTHRTPTHPGEMLLEEFLTPMGLTQRGLADAIAAFIRPTRSIFLGQRGSSKEYCENNGYECHCSFHDALLLVNDIFDNAFTP